jgi:peptide/nickel transport system substrate-binding protein
VLPEYAAAMAQFRAGRLATYAVLPQDVLGTKNSTNELTMLANDEFPVSASWIRFSYLPDSPFRDDRVRKALSMLLDRDLYIKTFGNVDEFEKAGLAVPTRWHSPIPCGEEGYWLDPKEGKDLGAGAKFFQFDPSEAKKLLAAAGHTKAVESKLTYSNSGTDGQRQAEVMKGMWETNNDFRLTSQVVDFVSEFRPKYSQASNKHEGIAYSGASGYPDIDGWLWIYYKSGSERSGHLDSNGQVDATLDDLISKQRVELDSNKRISIVKDIQRHLANKMYMLNEPGRATGYLLAWPWLGNFGVFRSRTESLPAVEGWTHYWIDPKLKTS